MQSTGGNEGFYSGSSIVEGVCAVVCNFRRRDGSSVHCKICYVAERYLFAWDALQVRSGVWSTKIVLDSHKYVCSRLAASSNLGH